ncbi:ATP-binding response regulator [Chitinophaga ginsengisegetis]|uniref:ATP-binding response regulator n=1 Tax=Chitinophaga ginsengisegetis TaxID=393003 RepID=UPI000DB957FD|nr:ATP-binding protein [Chitinophaga ginsengisegetis]MDR6570540.1 signal transduction histidine kinase/ActR/RegA family two-component response regulator [Chitinophaga ginsengisegetis]MDR6650274.1 signal transduction histidine kinase/ActR/RegA family two-component response regulator [Chitinophaga ginsengisegetis]MDR6656607.1 signal transduction histidine kinase/ActR/RegA family two-component response regulator [Chitinophaga ginsengisegetis]
MKNNITLTRMNSRNAEANETKERIIKIVNSLAISASLLAFTLGCLLYYMTGYGIIFYPAMLESALFLSTLLITRYSKPVYGKQLMFLLHSISIWFFGVLLGPASQIYLFAPFLAFCVFLVFEKPLSQVLALVASAVVMILVVLNFRYPVIASLQLSKETELYLHWLVIIAATFLNGTALYYFAKESRFQNKQLKSLVNQLDKANQAMRIYVRETTHEIRSPLNVVNSILQNYIETADQGKKTVQVGIAHLEAVHFACQDMQLVMSNALGWSKIEEGKDEICHSPFHFSDWVQHLCDTYEYLAKRRSVHINISLSDNLPEYILADKSKLRTIIVNLLSNAIKFTTFRSIITVKAGMKNNQLVVSVTDQGVGISADRKEHIFDPYVSEPGQHTESSGLGLPIARHMARMMGGDLSVTDNPDGGGSIFTLRMPVETTTPPPATDHIIDYSILNGLKVLVVDDDHLNHLAFSLALKRMGIEAILADSGPQGLTKARLHQPDAILMDMIMPYTSGVEMLSQFRADRQLRQIPFILVSGNAYSEVKEEVIASGADGFLSKPVNIEQLYTILRDLVIMADTTRPVSIAR